MGGSLVLRNKDASKQAGKRDVDRCIARKVITGTPQGFLIRDN